VVVVLKEKAWSSLAGNSFPICEVDGKVVLNLRNKSMSLHNRKVLCDVTGNELGMIRKEIFTMHKRKTIYSPDEKPIATVALTSREQSQDNASVALQTGERIVAEGNIFGRNYKLRMGGVEIARVHHEFHNDRNIFEGKADYFLTVHPNVDLAFMVLATMCLDEIFAEDGK